MLSGDEETDVLLQHSEAPEVLLSQLTSQQAAATSTFWKRTWEFIRLVIFRQTNVLEKFILENEPSDCAFVAKYGKTVALDLAAYPKLSVNRLSLSSLHAPHPLTNFAKDEPLAPNILQEVSELPVIVFIHGLGGQMSQFEPLMVLLSQCLEIVALDLPGFGNSKLNFKDNRKIVSEISDEEKTEISSSVGALLWGDYATENLVSMIKQFITQTVAPEKKVILVGHSMGTHLITKTANVLDEGKVEGLVILSPPPFVDDVRRKTESKHPFSFASYLMKFAFIFNLFRVWDRLPGLISKSVYRQLSRQSNLHQRARQFRWNLDIETNVLLRYISGFQRATYLELVTAISRLNNNVKDPRTYEKTLLAGGIDDQVTPVKIIHDLNGFLTDYWQRKVCNVMEVKNAGHSLLLSKPEFISGLVLKHFELRFPERLHLLPAWVLKLKAEISGDKWGLKNEIKWLQTQAISYNITRRNGNDVAKLLGMKTLREGDENHSPLVVERKFYGDAKDRTSIKGKLIAIVDISADIPPYSPKTFEIIQYYKCATVSKVVPDHVAIRRFIQLIDDILGSTSEPEPLIAVHCHYGFNRTGFFICCYLIERCGWSVREAVDGYKNAKPPGIKHPHFVDALYVRYER